MMKKFKEFILEKSSCGLPDCPSCKKPLTKEQYSKKLSKFVCGQCAKNESVTEGMTKHALEDKLEKMCECDGGISIDSNEHDSDCPCYKYLKNLGY
jgi:transposase-like protein